MNNNFFRAAIFTILLFSNNAFANFYLGGHYTYTIVSPEVLSDDDFTPSVLHLKGGYDVVKYVGVELRAGVGITDGSRVVSNVEQTISIDSMYGGYLKLQGGGRNANPYLMFGYTKVDMKGEGGGITVTPIDDESVSYGIGIDGTLSETTFFTLEYMNYYDEDAANVSGIGLGITARF